MSSDSNDQLLRIEAARKVTGHTRSGFYSEIRSGRLPPGVPIGARCKAWPRRELQAYIQSCIAARDSSGGAA